MTDLSDPSERERLRASLTVALPNQRSSPPYGTVHAALLSALDLIENLIAERDALVAEYREQFASAKEMWDEAGLKVGEPLPNDAPRNHFIMGMFAVLRSWDSALSSPEHEETR